MGIAYTPSYLPPAGFYSFGSSINQSKSPAHNFTFWQVWQVLLIGGWIRVFKAET
jgi:hypothetical protein